MTQEAGTFPYPDDVSREEAHCRRFAAPEGVASEAVVRARDADMLAATVRWAREQRRPLVPASSTSPHRRASLNLPKGAWILDFSGMQQVIKIDRRNRVALFEPGVSFQELASQVRQHGLRTLTSLHPRPRKSALSAYLDREPVIQPRCQWDLADPLLCIEASYRQFHCKLTDIHFLVDRESLANIVASDAQERERSLREADAWNLIYSVSGIFSPDIDGGPLLRS